MPGETRPPAPPVPYDLHDLHDLRPGGGRRPRPADGGSRPPPAPVSTRLLTPAAASVPELDPEAGARIHICLPGLHAEAGVRARVGAEPRALATHRRHVAVRLVEPLPDATLP